MIRGTTKSRIRALGQILLSRRNIESGYRSELKAFQMFKAVAVWPRGEVYCLGHLSQGDGNIVYMVGKRPCVYTDVFSFRLTDAPAARRTTIFSATGHMHFALVHPLIQKRRRTLQDNVGVLAADLDGNPGELRWPVCPRQATYRSPEPGLRPRGTVATVTLPVPSKGQRFPRLCCANQTSRPFSP